MDNSESRYRTVVIDNIHHEISEDRLMDKFGQIGNILKFKMIKNSDLLRSTMVAYCEYSHIEMAVNAYRNLNGIEMLGQKLRVALVTESEEMEKSMSSIPECSKDQNPESGEAISQAVASLPPDQMYELMKQMKLCIQNNPNEARNMLLQNPQLAYALLQAQIVMKIADPKVAIAMLNRSSEQIPQMTQESPVGKSLPTFQASGHNVSSYPINEQHSNILAPSSSFEKGFQNPDPRIENLSKFLTSSNQISFVPGNTTEVIQAPPQQISGNISNAYNRLKNEKVIKNSLSEQEEREKAALILQVLKLTDQQIAMLPDDQRQSILVLKEQLRKN